MVYSVGYAAVGGMVEFVVGGRFKRGGKTGEEGGDPELGLEF